MKNIILAILFLTTILINLNEIVNCYVHTPVSRIKIPRKIHDVSYKGSVFSYTASNRDTIKSIRDYALETDDVKLLEERFVEHFTETILSKLANELKSGIPSMSIPPLDPLRLNEIRVEPYIGNEIFTINLNNVEIEGLSEVDIQDIRPRLNALKVRLALIFPKMTANCHFTVNGTIYNVIDVFGEGDAKLEYSDVLVRTQLNLVHENKTFKISNCDPPLVDFNTAKIVLSNEGHNYNRTSKVGIASELGPLLFWVFADHVVQEINQYLLKYVNNNMLLFKVPENFNPAVTWLLNKGSSSNHIPIISPFPFLHHWINSLASLKPLNSHNRFFKK